MILYHLLNRGVDKRQIFMDQRDYFRFIHNLFEFNDVAPAEHNFHRAAQLRDIGRLSIGRQHKRTLLVQIHCFCLMPNHYHFLVSPLVENGIPLFMKKINMGYAKYFNERYKRSGALFQGKYKSIPIKGDPHFSWIPYYIHFNPLDVTMPEWRERGIKNPKKAEAYLKTYRWSSHLDYLGKKNFPSLTQRNFYLKFFDGEKGYRESMSNMLHNFSVQTGESVMLEK